MAPSSNTPAFVPCSVFRGVALHHSRPRVSTRPSTTTTTTTTPLPPRMTHADGEQKRMSRRQLLVAGAAAAVAVGMGVSETFAKSGDSPKISVFGVGGASSPFTAGIQSGGKVLYSELGDDEINLFKKIATKSQERIAGAADSIKAKSWEDIRSRIRLEASDLRRIQMKVNDALSGDEAKQALKATAALKLDMEKLDQACVQKNQDKAYKNYNAILKDIDNWNAATGF